MTHPLNSLNDLKTMMLAGNCTLTVKSVRTGVRFTYKVTKGKEKINPYTGSPYPTMYFVNLLAGPDNNSDYSPLGCLRGANREFQTGRWCKVPPTATSYKAFAYLCNLVDKVGEGENILPVPEGLEVWHEGKCGRCGRKLTVPESIAIGIGPECLEKTVFY